MKTIRVCFHLPQLPIWLSALILLAPVYLAGKALFWGTPLLQFGPWWAYAWETLLSGHLPLWNPLVGMGAPLLANYQSALLYPPNWVYLALYAAGGATWMAWGMALIAALHLVWAGLGMARLARRLNLNVLAQALSGLAFGLSGYLVARLGFLSINAAAAWLPWVLLWLTPSKGRSGMARRDLLGLVLCLAFLLLAGHAQTAWYILLLAGLWSGLWAFKPLTIRDSSETRSSLPAFKRLAYAWLWLGLALILALGLSAAQLLPTAEYLAQSQRLSQVGFDFAMNYSFWPWHLLTLIAPGLFGSPVSGDYWGYANYWEDAVYIGLLPLLLAVYAFFKSLPGRADTAGPLRILSWFLASLVAVALLFSLGKNTPVFPWLYQNVPTFEMFQAPARWMLWAEFALALLAGLGAHIWRRPHGWGLYWTRLATMGAFAVSLGAALAWYLLGEISPTFIRATAILGFLGGGVGALTLLAPPGEVESSGDLKPSRVNPSSELERPASPRTGSRERLFQFAPPASRAIAPYSPFQKAAWRGAVSAFVAFDLILAGWGLNPAGPLELYGPAPTAGYVRRLADGGRIFLAEDDDTWLKYTRFLRFDTFDPGESWINLRAVLLPNTQMLDELPSVSNFDPLLPARYVDWLRLLGEASPAHHRQLMQLMGVGVVETLNGREAFGVRFDSFGGRRLRLVPCGRLAATPMEARQFVSEEASDFDRLVILEGLAALPADDCQSPDASVIIPDQREPVIDERLGPNRIEVIIPDGPAAWLVLSDLWYPGWRAWVDDQPVELLRADYLFRAIRLPAGEHRVVMAYQPLTFWAGICLWAISLILLGGLCLRSRASRDIFPPAHREEEALRDV